MYTLNKPQSWLCSIVFSIFSKFLAKGPLQCFYAIFVQLPSTKLITCPIPAVKDTTNAKRKGN